MTTLKNTTELKIKVIEVKYSNITFLVEARAHYMSSLREPNWSKNKYTATIKETGENIGGIGDRKFIKSQMNVINSVPHLFLNNSN